MQRSSTIPLVSILLPVVTAAILVFVWWIAAEARYFPPSSFPSPPAVWLGFVSEVQTGRLTRNLIASLYRVGVGFLLAVVLSLPVGLLMGQNERLRAALLPSVNFFRALSPLAWIPFAVLWFGIGDAPAVFLIFMASFFPLCLAVLAAVANIPAVYYQVAQDYQLTGTRMLFEVTIPAIMPQYITSLRVAAGVAWMVVVAAEMLAGKDGLGFAVWDSRNGLRTDLLVCQMFVIGAMGVALDRALVQLTRLPSVRWGYER